MYLYDSFIWTACVIGTDGQILSLHNSPTYEFNLKSQWSHCSSCMILRLSFESRDSTNPPTPVPNAMLAFKEKL